MNEDIFKKDKIDEQMLKDSLNSFEELETYFVKLNSIIQKYPIKQVSTFCELVKYFCRKKTF